MKKLTLAAVAGFAAFTLCQSALGSEFSSLEPVYNSYFSGGVYIVPNEDEYYRFDPSLRNQSGVIISVGTFRTLEAASRGQFSMVVMADVDGGVVSFNKLQINTLKNSPTPFEFITKIFGIQLDRATHDRILKAFDQKEFHQVDLQLRQEARRQDPEGGSTELKVRRQYISQILQFNDATTGSDQTFLADVTRYEKVRDLAIKQSIFALAVDLGGESFKQLSDILRKQKLKVGILDLSNVPDYVLRESEYKIKKVLANLKHVPFANSARINSVLPGLHYISAPVASYIATLEAHSVPSAYSRFCQSLRAQAQEPSVRKCNAF